MRWYWYLILFGVSVAVSTLVSASLVIHEKVFRGNSEQAKQILNGARKDASPVVQMRVATYDHMQALPHESLTMRSADGLNLKANWYPNGNSKKTAILVHGWRSAPWWDYGGVFELLIDAGYSVLAVSQRALYESEGKYVTYGVREQEDLRGWIDLVLQRFGADRSIALMGVSMGAATVLLATGKALPQSVKCAVSDCSYTRAADLFREGSKGWLPISRLCVDLVSRLRTGASYFPADAKKAVAHSQTPTYFVHGDVDEVVPYRMMGELYAACTAPKEQWTVPGAKHGEAYATDPEGYKARILPFLERYCSGGKSLKQKVR